MRKALAPVLVPSFGRRYSGLTSVVRTTTPVLREIVDVDVVEPRRHMFEDSRAFLAVCLAGYGRPRGVPFRIWHARRTSEILAGVLLRSVLRQHLRIVFTTSRQRPYKSFTGWVVRQADALIATSSEAASFVTAGAAVIPHGADCDLYHPAPNRKVAWAARGVGGRYGIGVFGRVRHQKGTDLFVDALLAVLPRHPDATAVIVGLVQPEDEAFVTGLRRRVAEAGLESRILFLGERPPDELPLWLAAVSIVVAPQRHEGFGLVPLEAGASGTPVVAARSGAAATLIEHGRTGLLVPAEDANALADAIETLMRDEALRIEMGRAARTRIAERFGVRGEAQSYVDVYRRLWTGAAPVPKAVEKRQA